MKYFFWLLLVGSGVFAQCANFNLSNFTTNGVAVFNTAGQIELTQNAGYSTGTLWANDRLDLSYDFTINSQLFFGADDNGADGISFTLQPLSVNAGSAGGGLGYEGITPSLSLEFDTYYNAGADPVSQADHIALIKNGQAEDLTAHSEFIPPVEMPNLEDGNIHNATFAWNAAAHVFKLTLDGTVIINTTLDIQNTVFSGNPYVYWGFTAATGWAMNLQSVKVTNYCVTTECSATTAAPTGNANQVFCLQGTVADLTATGNAIQWYASPSGGSPLSAGTSLSNGTYYASQTPAACESASRFSVLVTIDIPALPALPSPQYFCNSATVGDIQVAGTAVKWYDLPVGGSPLSVTSPLVDGATYYCTQTLLNCESHRAPVLIRVVNTVAHALPDLETCDDALNDGIETFDLSSQNLLVLQTQAATDFSVSYHASASEAISGNNPLPLQFRNTANPQTVYARVTLRANPLCYATTGFRLMVHAKPVIVIKDSLYLCNDNSILTISAGNGFDSYLWSTGETTSTINISSPKQYSLTVTKNYGSLTCSAMKNFEVLISQKTEITAIDVSDWTYDQNTLLIHVNGTGNYEYTLDNVNFQDSPYFYGLPIGVYQIYVKDKNGCGDTTGQAVGLTYPKFFTPNNDGYHDNWQIINAQYEPLLKTYVFDRYGKLITSIAPNSKGWDGTYNGRDLPSSDYWFLAIRQSGKEFRGHFTMKR